MTVARRRVLACLISAALGGFMGATGRPLWLAVVLGAIPGVLLW